MTARFSEKCEMYGIHGQRREDREDAAPEVAGEVLGVLLGQLGGVHQRDPGVRQLGPQLSLEQALLALGEHQDAAPDLAELGHRRHAVWRCDGRSRLELLLEPGHADLEEVVQVLPEVVQRPDPLQQGQ
jgi:hypothetical protein